MITKAKKRVCIIGSRQTIPQMRINLLDKLHDLSKDSNIEFNTSGCAGICFETIKFCVRQNISPRLNIWLAKRIRHIPKLIKPVVLAAKTLGASIIETDCKNYLDGIIERNISMIRYSDKLYGWRLDGYTSKGTTHEIGICKHFNKPLIMEDYVQDIKVGSPGMNRFNASAQQKLVTV